MKISGYQTWAVRVPYEAERTGYHVVLRLRTDEGLEGIAYLGFARDPLLRTVLEALCERVLGEDPLAVERLNARLLPRGSDGFVKRAASAIDVACWDIRGKALGQPLHRLLGGFRDRVPAYAGWRLWWQYDLKTLAANAEEHARNGFRAMKFRIGGMRTQADVVERTRVMREAAGPDVDLIVDANAEWSTSQAIAFGREMARQRLFWFEDPVAYNDHDAADMVARAVDAPVCVGESFTSASQFVRQLEGRAVAYYMIDLDVGGLTPWLKIAHLLDAHGRPVASHLGPEILCHAVAAVPNGVIVEYLPWAAPLFQGAPEPVAGEIVLSDRPGLGMELDLQALEHFAA
jgi:L-alanine-DL-glutamate epimerase-like enolase superfamily enzyme